MSDHVEVRYARQGDQVRVKLKGMTNHEIREVLVGLWSRLDDADRADHINELVHYLVDPKAFLSPVATAIRDGDGNNLAIDISKLIRQEHGEDTTT